MSKIVQGPVAGTQAEPRASICEDLDKGPVSPSQTQGLMVLGDVDEIPTTFISITDVFVESVVAAVILVHIGILAKNHKC